MEAGHQCGGCDWCWTLEWACIVGGWYALWLSKLPVQFNGRPSNLQWLSVEGCSEGAWRAGVVNLPCFSYLAMNRMRFDSGIRVCARCVGCVCAVGLLVVEFGCIDSVLCTLCVASCGKKK